LGDQGTALVLGIASVIAAIRIDEDQAYGGAQHIHWVGVERRVPDHALTTGRAARFRLGDNCLSWRAWEVPVQQQIGGLLERRMIGQVVDVIATVDEPPFCAEHITDRRFVGDDSFQTATGGVVDGGRHGGGGTPVQGSR
jgi:hypothetical protein